MIGSSFGDDKGGPKGSERYVGRPLLRLLDYFVLASIGMLDAGADINAGDLVSREFGHAGANWRTTLVRELKLPPDMEARIRTLWRSQPAGVDPIAFAVAVSDQTFAPLIDRIEG